MKHASRRIPCLFAAALLSPLFGYAQPVVGQFDSFEDGTTANWTINLLGFGGVVTNPPTNIATGGPGGADDNFLRLTSTGLTGAGGRMTALNAAQWAGDYLNSGIAALRVDARNAGNTDLSLRLMFEDAMGGPPQNVAVSTQAASLVAGSGWTSLTFAITATDLTPLLGTVADALGNTTILRIYHDGGANIGFPGVPIAAQLDLDNLRAVGPRVPDSGPSLALLGGLLVALAALGRRR